MPVANAVDETHDPGLRSWVDSANGHPEFPIQNLPLCVFRCGDEAARGGIAIGDSILDLVLLAQARLLSGDAQIVCEVCGEETLNSFLALGSAARRALRRGVSLLLGEGSERRESLLKQASDCVLQLPVCVGDFTDFYAGIHHARDVGAMFRPDSPLLPNYKWMPVGYHGRASSVFVSGEDVRRPSGQRKYAEQEEPIFGPSERLDYELELGVWIGTQNAIGQPVPIENAAESIAGYSLLNDWSARDLQTWEYQPLGPFLAKSFHTTVSPWIVTPEALAPFRIRQIARPEDDPRPLPHLFDLSDQEQGALDIQLEVFLSTAAMRKRGLQPARISRGNAVDLYWTPAQLVAHHTSNGCNLRSGDLLGTGTISSPSPDGGGSLLEMTVGGTRRLQLPEGESRAFLEDADEVILRARAVRQGFASIGFGDCCARVLPTHSPNTI